MKTILRLLSAALVALIFASVALPAGAESSASARRRREEARRKKAQIAAQLNTLKASDSEMEKAVAALDAQVRSQQAVAAGARQALAAAEQRASAIETQLAATEKEITDLHSAVVGRAVAAYVRPQEGLIDDLAQAKDLGEASRRQSLLQQVANHDAGVIDRLHAARQDQMEQQAAAKQARDVAAERRKQVDAKLREVEAARAEKRRLEDALDARIKEFQQQADLVAGQEAQLNELIRRGEERERQRASRSSAPAIDTGGRVSGAGLIWPTSGRVTSEYGYRWGRLHAGIDIAAPTGTPIRAAKAGEVIYSGVMNGYGNVVVIAHGGGFSTLYAHQSRIAASDGQQVAQGQLIGYVGNTGRSTGPHLHFETRVNGSAQNPRRYLP